MTQTREEWLQVAVTELRPLFRECGANVPDVYVSVGWPKGSRGGHKAIGQCFPPALVADSTPAVFISPELPNAANVLHVLVHELVHATVGCEHGHKGPFRKLASAVGLEGKMTATHAGPDLALQLDKLAERIGEYPHAQVTRPTAKQTTRMLKAECAPCGYIVRLSRKAADYGMPTCPCGDIMELAS